MDMMGPSRGAARSRARASRNNPFSRGTTGRNSTNTKRIEGVITRGMESGDIVRLSQGDRALKEVPINPNNILISVKGWTESKAAKNPGGGTDELMEFLQRKAGGIHLRKVSHDPSYITNVFAVSTPTLGANR